MGICWIIKQLSCSILRNISWFSQLGLRPRRLSNRWYCARFRRIIVKYRSLYYLHRIHASAAHVWTMARARLDSPVKGFVVFVTLDSREQTVFKVWASSSKYFNTDCEIILALAERFTNLLRTSWFARSRDFCLNFLNWKLHLFWINFRKLTVRHYCSTKTRRLIRLVRRYWAQGWRSDENGRHSRDLFTWRSG